jgi:DNA-binding NtrC family response regulator
LLRFLETGEIQRIGSDRAETRVDVRVIAATNRNLVDAVAAKTFREDLYYRLNVIQLHIPPLRERREDIAPLLASFLTGFAAQYQVPRPSLAPDALEALLGHSWPGNVRELKNVAERLIVRRGGQEIRVCDLPGEIGRAAQPGVAPLPERTRGESVAEVLFNQIVREGNSFWTVVYGPFMSRDLTRDDLRAIVRKGLERTSGNYRFLVELLNMPPDDYKRFLGFLRKFHCHLPFQQFRTAGSGGVAGRRELARQESPERASREALVSSGDDRPMRARIPS